MTGAQMVVDQMTGAQLVLDQAARAHVVDKVAGVQGWWIKWREFRGGG